MSAQMLAEQGYAYGHAKVDRKNFTDASILQKILLATEELWEQEKWSSPGKCTSICYHVPNSQPRKYRSILCLLTRLHLGICTYIYIYIYACNNI